MNISHTRMAQQILTKKMMKAVSNKFNIKSCILFILLSTLFSCQNKRSNYDEEMYEVFSVIHEKTIRDVLIKGAFQPHTPKPNQDPNSIPTIDETITNAKKNGSFEMLVENWFDKVGKSVTCIYPKTTKGPKIEKNIKCDGFDILLEEFKITKNKSSLNIDFTKIKNSKYGSIEEFKDSFSTPRERDLHTVQYFSPISFSDDYKKAIVISSTIWGKLTGYSKIYFLDNINGWNVVCEYHIGPVM